MSSNIIIVSSARDEHIPFVTKFLDKRKIIRIDPLDILIGEDISYKNNKGEIAFIYEGKLLNNILSIWYRHPTPLSWEELPVKDTVKDYSFSSLLSHIQMLFGCFPEALWISNIAAIERSKNKPLQQEYAYHCGLKVPKTLYTSSPLLAKDFINKLGICIAKSQANIFPEKKLNFTKIITTKDKLEFNGLRYDPYIFQEYIEPSAEIRVAVVGNKAFASIIHGKEVDGVSSTFRDWRYAHFNNTFKAEAFTLPKDISNKCIDLVRNFGLQFGAIDLILDKERNYWFLEINPNGQWAFVDDFTVEEIGKAIATLLVNGK